VTEEWRKLNNEELNDLVLLPNLVRAIISRMRWAGHVAFKGRGGVYSGFRWGNLSERGHLVYPGIDGRIILRWFLGNGILGYVLDLGGGHL